MLELKNIHCKISSTMHLQVNHLKVSKGQLCGIIGPNGAGKTTLFKIISGDIPYQGSLRFHGQKFSDWKPIQRARHLAVLLQASQLSFPFTAKEVVSLGLTPLSLGKHEARVQVQHYMDLTDCRALAGQSYPSLSGGERQRVQLARVLLQLSQATQTPLLLLDEPTSAQDLSHQHQILALAKELCREREYGVLVILHDLNQAMYYCDVCAQLDQGRLVAIDHPSQILNEDNIERYWKYRPIRIEHPSGHPVFI